jgi:hypothetical protein
VSIEPVSETLLSTCIKIVICNWCTAYRPTSQDFRCPRVLQEAARVHSEDGGKAKAVEVIRTRIADSVFEQ